VLDVERNDYDRENTRGVAWFGGTPPTRAFEATQLFLRTKDKMVREGAPGVNLDRTHRVGLAAILGVHQRDRTRRAGRSDAEPPIS
jgi:hypothetical protein